MCLLWEAAAPHHSRSEPPVAPVSVSIKEASHYVLLSSGSSLSVIGPAVRRWIPDPLLDDPDQTECTVVSQAAAFWSIYTPPPPESVIQQNLSLKFKGFISSYTYVALKIHIQFCICHIFPHFILFSQFLKSLDFAGVCFENLK